MYLKDTSELDGLTLKIQIATCPAAYTTSNPFLFAVKHQSACSSVRLFLHTKNLYMCTPSLHQAAASQHNGWALDYYFHDTTCYCYGSSILAVVMALV
jgi:hypothetical protein